MTLVPVYWLIGSVLAFVAFHACRDPGNPRRLTSGAFWGLLAFSFLLGERVPAEVMGVVAVALALLAGAGGVSRPRREDRESEGRRAGAVRLGHRLFLPALAIPAATLVLVFALRHLTLRGQPLVAPAQQTLWSLALACVAALALGCQVTRRGPATALHAARDLVEAIGWAGVLPLMLATLGVVFSGAGVGDLLARGVGAVIPVESRLACVVAYAVGMALFTVLMGNAFAAFPVMTAGIGLPLLVRLHGADPASLSAIGMLSGYCGTLLTPMAANFNIVPAALLELDDTHGVIKAQAPTGLPLLAANVVLMSLIVFR